MKAARNDHRIADRRFNMGGIRSRASRLEIAKVVALLSPNTKKQPRNRIFLLAPELLD